MTPKFSIVIPFFNAGHTLQETLESVSAQSYGEFEVILVNDGSTDSSANICKQWQSKNPDLDITLIEQQNQGLGNARNTGIKKASHAWLALLDADDLWEPAKLAIIAATLQQIPADIYYHPVKTFGLKRSKVRPCLKISTTKDILIKGNPIIPSTVVGKTQLFQEYLFSENPDFHGAEDLYLWISMLNDEIIFEKIDSPLTRYRETGGMSTDIEDHLKRVLNVLNHFCQKDFYNQRILAKAKRRKYLEVARFYHKRKNFTQANRFYTMADFKSLKILGLRTLSLLGINV